MTVDGERHELSGYSVAVANSRAYGGGMFLAPQAQLDDGLLDVVTTGRSGKLEFLRKLPKVFKGAHLGEPSVHVLRGARDRGRLRPHVRHLRRRRPDRHHPATVTVTPRCLRVIVPG